MKTRIPKLSPPDISLRPDDRVMEIRRYKLITPLFGGGVEAQRADPITIIRGASVRGQLRFWWRATHGGQFNGNLKDMRARENAIWGSAAKKEEMNGGPSKVTLTTKNLIEGKPFAAVDNRGQPVTNLGDQRSVYSYVAFPLREAQGAKAIEGIEFELMLRYPQEIEADVQAALWAWQTFGGIGGRTRRGFGALQLTHVNGNVVQLPTSTHLQAEIRNGFRQHVVSGKRFRGGSFLEPDDVVVVAKSKKNDAIQTWQYLFDRLKKFRQDRYDKNGQPYGRSKWPEPDAIRRLTKKHSRGHEPKHSVDGKFPRAQFGLPIIFQFKESDEKMGDPPAMTLIPRDAERWASPLILRPIACSDGSIGLAVRLDSSLNDVERGIVLEGKDKRSYPAEWELSEQEASQIEPLHGEPDVIQAFLENLKR